jgi:hypothetical protein
MTPAHLAYCIKAVMEIILPQRLSTMHPYMRNLKGFDMFNLNMT